jgi:hypothetical protein
MTLFHAATKSLTNFCWELAQAQTSALVAGSLHQRWRGIEFIKKHNSGAVLRQERRDCPSRAALLNRGQPAQIDRVKQDGADIDQANAQ